ncbi:MAG: OmpA family protein [Synechococcus sp.]
MSHWTKAAVITVGLAAGIGAGVAWTSSPATSLPEVKHSETAIQAMDGVAQTSRQSAPTDEDGRSESGSGDRVLSPPESGEEVTPHEEQASSSQTPVSQTSPQPQFSPVTPRPLGDRSNADPEAEIRAIRRELLQLLNRLEDLEARLEGGNALAPNSPDLNPTNSESPDSHSADSSSVTANESTPSLDSSSPASSFFDGPPPPQLSLGTQTISLPGDVLFDFSRSEIRPEAATLLEQVAGILESMPYSHIQVAGHTDDVGSTDYNLVLSVERATAVQEFLREVLPDNGQGYRWTSTGYGEAAPVADNETEEGRQRNRRVDLIVSPQ